MKKFEFNEIMIAEDLAKIPFTEGYRMELNFDKEILFERKPRMIIGMIIVEVKDYVNGPDGDYADQLDNFAEKLLNTEYIAQYGYDTDFTDEATADAAYNRFIYTKRTAALGYPKSWTSKRNEARNGTGSTVSVFPVGSDVSTPPTEVPPGSELRFRNKAQLLKENVATTEAAEIDLGISTVHSGTDTSTAKPVLTYEFVAGGHPMIHYIRGIYDGIELNVDRGDGHGMVLLDKISNTRYIDNGTLPAAGVSVVWKYQAIYRLSDGRIGNWSLIVPVTVTGV
jgi:hypothetical protein